MDLFHIVSLLLKRKKIILVGVFVGVVFAFMSLYKMGSNGIEPRKLDMYRTSLSLIIEDSRFSLGRTDLDVSKGLMLAPTYAYIVKSDVVLEEVRKKIGDFDERGITCEPARNSPVITITIEGEDPDFIETEANTIAQTFISYLKEKQIAGKVPEEERLIVSVLDSPSEPERLSSKDKEIALIFFIFPILLTCGFILMLENISSSNYGKIKRTRETRNRTREGLSERLNEEPELYDDVQMPNLKPRQESVTEGNYWTS